MEPFTNQSLMTLFSESNQRQSYHKKIGQFTLKFADCLDELSQVFKLRYQVFWNESDEDRWDVDLFDLAADHLIIIDDNTQKVVGTYRLINSKETTIYYSQSEFKMDAISHLEGSKVECGRACIHKDYRNGTTIGLLWQGLGDYIIHNEIRWMFGCSSIHAQSPKQSQLIHQHLMKHHLVEPALQATPENPALITVEAELTPQEERMANRILPPLLRTYLKLGAKICGHPHLDEEMNCIDYLTLLDTSVLNEDFEKRFCSQ